MDEERENEKKGPWHTEPQTKARVLFFLNEMNCPYVSCFFFQLEKYFGKHCFNV